MNKIAIRNHMGDWVYYVTSLSFKEVADNVCKITDELHSSKTLSEMIQRSLTNNVNKISDYILNQNERFFNALVLAVYDGDPQWREIKLDYGEGEVYNIGILEFNGDEKIFPVDGQHRVEGIKLALEKDKSCGEEMIPVIFIGHKSTDDGMRRTRRLFSTLNRYAKPVSLNDIIALDEDDSVAIATREIIENLPIFKGNRVRNDKQKAIPDKDKEAITNVISLYECNKELISYAIKDEEIRNESNRKLKGSSKLDYYCRFRPDELVLSQHVQFVDSFWNSVCRYIDVIINYIETNGNATLYRNADGGNLLFRPIGQKPFTKVAIRLYDKYKDWSLVMTKLNRLNLSINQKPWVNVAWNDVSKKMISASNGKLIELLLAYMVNDDLLNEREMKKLIDDYREKQLYTQEEYSDEDIKIELEGYQI